MNLCYHLYVVVRPGKETALCRFRKSSRPPSASSSSSRLTGLILSGELRPGDRLPTHDELQEWYGVSRDTTVKAIRMLQDWGVVKRRLPGGGSRW